MSVLTELRITDLECNVGSCPDGWVHRKCIPYAIIVQATEGSYTVTGAEQAVTIRCNEVALVAADAPIAFAHHASASGRMTSRWMHVKAVYREAIDPCALHCSPHRIGGALGVRIGGLLEELIGLGQPATDDALASTIARLGIAYQALGLALGSAPRHPRAAARLAATARLGPLTAWLNERLQEPLSVDTVAGRAGLSRSRLHALFHEHLGLTPMAYLKELRLACAARLLLTGNDSVAQIAERSGFANPFHFSREFTRRYGVPPRRYRSTQRLSFAPG